MPDKPLGRKNQADDYADLLTRLFNKAAAIEQDPVDTGDGTLLFTSEVHLIDMAGRFPDEGMTRLASRLGITKSAVSQTAKKLEAKGYLERYTRKGDNRTILLRLTPRGEQVYGWHRRYHEVVNERISLHIAALAPREQETIGAVLTGFEQIFDACPEMRRAVTRALEDENQTD